MTNPPIHRNVHRPAPRAPAVLAATAFVGVLLGVSFWIVREFVVQPNKAVLLPPEMARQAQAAMTPPVARELVTAAPNSVPPTFTGNVLDARTLQPIADFTVHIGISFSKPYPKYVDSGSQFHGGRYAITAPFASNSSEMVWYFRIDAPGHIPLVSRVQEKSSQQDFKLQPGNDISGVVVDTDGAPAAGITVLMAVPGLDVVVDPANMDKVTTAFKATTGPDGRFSFPPQPAEFALAAIGERGCSEADQTDPAAPIVMHLVAWGRIQGRLTITGRPSAHQRIVAECYWEYGPNKPMLGVSSETQTATDGTFHFDEVIPGTTCVFRYVTRTAQYQHAPLWTELQNTQTETVMATAGKLVTVNLGGIGRPVVGKVVLPPGAGAIGDYFITGRVSVPVASPPPATPDVRSYAVESVDGGTFRFEDVAPGTYQVSIHLASILRGQPLKSASLRFTVPPVPGGGYSNQPFVLPDMRVYPAAQ